MILTKEIIKTFFDKTNTPNFNYYKEFDFSLYKDKNIIEEMYLIYHDIKELQLCENCKNELKFINFKEGYGKFCSKKCYYQLNPRTSKRLNNIQKYTIEEKGIEYFLKPSTAKQLLIPENYLWCKFPFEYIYCYKNNIVENPKCKNCKNDVIFLNLDVGYQQTCSSKCRGNLEETKEKRKKTVLKKYGVSFVSQLEENKKKTKQTKLEKYGDENFNNKEKYNKTCFKKNGYTNIFKDIEYRKEWENKRITNIRTNSSNINNWVSHPENVDINIEKRIQTCIEKYGVKHYVQSQEAQLQMDERINKIWATKKNNGTTNTSKIEDEIYNVLVKHFKIVHREYKDERYPYRCDFYIEDIDLYIEYQGYFTHGYDIYLGVEKDLILLDKWKSKDSLFYKNAIKNWIIKDVEKREHAKNNKLNFLEIFNIDKNNLENNVLKQIERVFNLKIEFSKEELNREFQIIKEKPGALFYKPTQNKIIKHFQTHFYHKEQELFKDPIVRRKLIQNRIEYLYKKEEELSNRELLSGFKISGIYKGYSFFSPLWIKYFIEQHNIKTLYDPFGGWGHRLLGASNLDLYIYNDLSIKTYTNIKNIVEYFDIKNSILYNEDASYLKPKEEYEAIFTCPPYDDIEKYENNINDFEKLMRNTFTNVFLNSNAKICGIIIKENFEDLLVDVLGKYVSKELVNSNKDHFKSKKTFEYLYVWKK